MSKGKMSKQEMDWQAESDMHCLAQAAEIRKDKARLRRAVACAKTKAAALQAVVKG